jgi:hypothetical protein
MCWATVNTLTGGVKTILAEANSDELLFVIGNISYMTEDGVDGVVNGVLLPSIALNCLPGCYTKMFNCSGILD